MSRYTVWFSLLLVSACGGTTLTHEEGGNGGSTQATGGDTSSGGRDGTGGHPGGSTSSSGGSTASGGTKATGGRTGSGGVTATGGAGATGGAIGSGGTGPRTREPKTHRPEEVPCGTPPMTPTGPQGPSPAPTMCTMNSECTAGPNGRCLQQRAGKYCVYDACFVDDDCASGGVCRCGSPTGSGNACIISDCRIDADCPGSYCSPTFGTCGTYGGVIGYQCHTPADACVDDADCGGAGAYCMYDPNVAHWVCSSSQCAG